METYDIGIVGAGPGGIACAIQARKRGLSYLIIEKGSRVFQGIIDSYPRGKKVYATIPKGETDPFAIEALTPASDKPPVEEYVAAIENLVEQEQIEIQFGEDFKDVTQDRNGFTIVTQNRQFKARRVVLAFGSNIPIDLGVYGEAKTVARNLDNPQDYIADNLTA